MVAGSNGLLTPHLLHFKIYREFGTFE